VFGDDERRLRARNKPVLHKRPEACAKRLIPRVRPANRSRCRPASQGALLVGMSTRRLTPRFVALLVYALAVNALVWASAGTHHAGTASYCVAQGQSKSIASPSLPGGDLEEAHAACAMACASAGAIGLLTVADHAQRRTTSEPSFCTVQAVTTPTQRLAWHARAPPILS
jgi:hypothetical protein